MGKRLKKWIAIVVTGILAIAAIPITACKDEGIVEYEGTDRIKLMCWCDSELRGLLSTAYQIHFNDILGDCVYECCTENGYLYDNKEIPLGIAQKQIAATSNTVIYWVPSNTWTLSPQPQKDATKNDYIEIVIKENDKIIGYALIRVRLTERGYFYGYLVKVAELWANDFDITEQQVQKLIEKAKKL